MWKAPGIKHRIWWEYLVVYVFFFLLNQMLRSSRTRSISSTFLPFPIEPGLFYPWFGIFPPRYLHSAVFIPSSLCSKIRFSETLELTMLFKIASPPLHIVMFCKYTSSFLALFFYLTYITIWHTALFTYLILFIYYLVFWNISSMKIGIISVLFTVFFFFFGCTQS